MVSQPGQISVTTPTISPNPEKKNMSDVMNNFVQSKQCIRKMILSYFDHYVPNNQDPAHICCDFHSRQCRWDSCEFALALADIDVDIPQEQPSAVHLLQDPSGEELKKTTFDAEVKTQIRMDLKSSIPSQPATRTGKEYCR